ncbi:MAG: ABC transporter permease [Actinobacteria bacterium]|nr:ABC transporter permease [Actinomycetota bacterium]
MRLRSHAGARQVAIIVVVGTISAAVLLVGGLGGETLARVNREVSVDWRPAYDLLVLPQDADVSLTVNGTRVTEGNFMAALDGGISIKQWKKILAIPGVEVAAPIASVGYFRRELPLYHFADVGPGIYDIHRTVRWDNGVDSRIQAESSPPGLFSSPTEESKSACAFWTRYHLYVPPPLRQTEAERLAWNERVHADVKTTGFGSDVPEWFSEGQGQGWDCEGVDPGGVFSVYGIDPVQEAKLTGLDRATSGTYIDDLAEPGLGKGDYVICGGGSCEEFSSIPLILNSQSWTKTEFRIRFERYDLPSIAPGDLADRAGPCPERFRQVVGRNRFCFPPNLRRLLNEAGSKEVVDTQIPISGTSIGGEMTYDNGRWKRTVRPSSVPNRNYLARPSAIRYEVLDDYPEGPWLGAVEALPTGSYGPEPTFRKQLLPAVSPFISYQVWGRFDGAAIAEGFSGRGRWLPEDTYRPPHAIRRFDLDGRPTEAQELRPTANPLGYLLEPPRALTTLKAARELLGRKPISAIRIRVAGVDEPGEEAWSRIENTARKITEVTGLDPLVTLGSSPARMLVKVPGVTKEEQPPGQTWRRVNIYDDYARGEDFFEVADPSRSVRGFGWVEEPWLTEGAAISYLRAGALQHLWLVLVLLTAALVYLVAAFTSLGLADIKVTAIRRAVGWSRRRVFLHQMKRAFLLGITGSVIGALLGFVAGEVFTLPVDLSLAFVGLPAGLLACCIAALFPAWRAGILPLGTVLSGGEVALAGSARRSDATAQHIFRIAVVELLRLRIRALLALAAGVVATGSLLVLIGIRTQFGGSLQVTVLGQAILLKTGPLQIAVTVAASVLAVALMGEILWQAVIDRRQDIGVLRAVG